MILCTLLNPSTANCIVRASRFAKIDAIALSFLIGLAVAAPTPATAQGVVSLDTFLAGVDDQCRFNTELKTLWRGLAQNLERGALANDMPIARRYVPIELRSVTGPINILKETDEYGQIRIPLQGLWRGVIVESIEFFIGKENGIAAFSVNFADPAARVRAVFQPLVTASARRMAADPDNLAESTIDLKQADGAMFLLCDVST